MDYISEADLPHDYESPRGEMEPTEPCAVCGEKREALIHS